jgi:hypothetical protein
VTSNKDLAAKFGYQPKAAWRTESAMSDQEQSSREASNGADSSVAALKQSVNKLRRKVDDQKERIEALARGREQGMETVGELRAELALVAAERDRLRKALTDLEGMQTETKTFDEASDGDATDAHQGELPSIDDLMSTFGSGVDSSSSLQSHSTLQVDSDPADSSGEYQEMISPDLIVFGSGRDKAGPTSERFLVLLEPGNHTKCQLDQDLLTIGRSESADIQIDGDFISRIHVRLLRIGMDTVVEDAGSKNGTWVNGERIKRQVLKHGDLIRVGSVNFRLVDSGAADGEPI